MTTRFPELKNSDLTLANCFLSGGSQGELWVGERTWPWSGGFAGCLGLGFESTVNGPDHGGEDHQGDDPQQECRNRFGDKNRNVPPGDQQSLPQGSLQDAPQ